MWVSYAVTFLFGVALWAVAGKIIKAWGLSLWTQAMKKLR